MKTNTNKIPVIYLLDENGEAEHVRRFCSIGCREQWTPNDFEVEFASTKCGFEDDVGVDGECCEYKDCGKTIEEAMEVRHGR